MSQTCGRNHPAVLALVADAGEPPTAPAFSGLAAADASRYRPVGDPASLGRLSLTSRTKTHR